MEGEYLLISSAIFDYVVSQLWHTIQGLVIAQIYTFCLFLSFSYVQNTPGLFVAFGFAYTSPMPVFVGLMLFTQTFWSPVEKVSGKCSMCCMKFIRYMIWVGVAVVDDNQLQKKRVCCRQILSRFGYGSSSVLWIDQD